MIRIFITILLLNVGYAWGQQLPDNAEEALKKYISLREGYKRSDTKQFSKMEQLEMDDWCFAMEKKFPDAWQTDFAWYLNDHFYNPGERITNAYKKGASDKRVVKAMFGYYIMTGDVAKQKEIGGKVAGYYSSNELAYYEDVLPSSGVLIVSSEQDALPLYVLQVIKGKGKSVTVVNMDYLINDTYRKNMADKLGTGSAKFFGAEDDFIGIAMASRNVYLSSTVPQNYLSKVAGNTSVTGLYYQTGVNDQMERLEKFWNRLVERNFSSMSLTSAEKKLYRNYLPPLMTLYKMKVSSGDKDEALRKAILAIAEKVEQTKTVNDILTAYDNG